VEKRRFALVDLALQLAAGRQREPTPLSQNRELVEPVVSPDTCGPLLEGERASVPGKYLGPDFEDDAFGVDDDAVDIENNGVEKPVHRRRSTLKTRGGHGASVPSRPVQCPVRLEAPGRCDAPSDCALPRCSGGRRPPLAGSGQHL